MSENPIRALSHALRNQLSPAMMLAERLTRHPDESVQRAGRLILESLDKAAQTLRAENDKYSDPTA
jgi:hypothetical protein